MNEGHTPEITEIARITVCFRSLDTYFHQVAMVTEDEQIVASCMVTGVMSEERKSEIQKKMLELFSLCVPDSFQQYEQ